ncbi:hypothetical protein DENSPDRAFT_231506 [Dentipellis sp. KUC8613]|nr:hypothetical protein DENSPDRAFT_231506 [Dentipellis sp. KUC8613]
MAAPTQNYPAWLSVSTSIATDPNGIPTATSTTVINLPLTYYGPPIPLGTDGSWVYGGLTSPPPESSSPSVTAAPSSSAIPSTSSSAIPSSSTTSSPTSSTISSQTSSSSLSGTSSTTSSTTPTAVAGNSSAHKRVIIGAVLGSVLGSLLLLILLILFLRWRARRFAGPASPRRRRDNPLWMWEMVDPPPPGQDNEGREAGEGSPRGSGEEHDSFLRRSVGATDGMKERDPSARLIADPHAPTAATAMGVAIAGADAAALHNSQSTRGSGEKTSTSGSQYASASAGSSGSRPSAGGQHIIPRDVLLRMYPDDDAETSATHTGGIRVVRDDDDHEARADSPLLPPPPLTVDTLPFAPRKESRQSLVTEGSVTPGNEPERATVQTARRVRVDDLGPRLAARTLTTVEDESPRDEAGPTWARAVGLGVGPLAKLRRLSFLSRAPESSGRSRPVSRPASLVAQGLTDAEIEGGRAGMSSVRPEMGYRDEGPRPISTVSGRSAVSSGGNSVYHDAVSRPQTPGSSSHPQSTSSTTGRGPGPSQLAISHRPEASGSASEPESAPPAYEATPPAGYPGATAHAASAPDVLDMPAPRAEVPFAERSQTRNSSPPGLMPLATTRAWRNSASVSGEGTRSPGSFVTAGTGSSGEAGITIDVLEEAPPAAGAGWRVMARGIAEQDRRTTFGMPPVYVHPRDATTSHEGFLHSMRSHLSPRSAYSPTGSAPTSRHVESPSGGTGSSNSRPSGHSRSGSSGASLVHSASISSDGRRRAHLSDLSPPISAVGRSSMVPPPVPPAVPSALHHAKSATVTSSGTTATGSSVTTHTSVTDPATGDVMRFPSVPWTGGLGHGHGRAQGEPEERESWAGSWGSPAHLKALQSRVSDQEATSHS